MPATRFRPLHPLLIAKLLASLRFGFDYREGEAPAEPYL